MKALIVGAGPVGCLLALGLRRRGFQAAIYEKGNDSRREKLDLGHSFNLTLSARGLKLLPPELVERLYSCGVRMHRRLIHHQDGAISNQPYGTAPDHHLLSIPRKVLHAHFLDEAERSGVNLNFQHECISVDLDEPSAAFAHGSVIRKASGDILAGCDGASSVVRRDMVQAGRTSVTRRRSDLGYVELKVPANAAARSLLPTSGGTKLAGVEDPEDAFHVWPRRTFMMIAQPNNDGSYTATLFLRFTSRTKQEPSFEHLARPAEVTQFFQRYFPDLLTLIPGLVEEFHAAPPAALNTIQCHQFHHKRVALLGDAAHTMLPFYGQGINCGFEDVSVFLSLLDRNLRLRDSANGILQSLIEFTDARRPACKAITSLSEANFQELAAHTADPQFLARADLERALYRQRPQQFVPLYCGIAFSTVPYNEVIEEYLPRCRRLDQLCDTHDLKSQTNQIIAAYQNDMPPLPEYEPGPGLELTQTEQKELLDLTTAYILRHQSDLAARKYPASYVHDSLNVANYEKGRKLSADLRDDEVPLEGEDLEPLLSEIFDKAIACGTVHPHPGFMAHIPSGGLLQGAVGAFIAKALNRFPGVWVAAPGLNQIECNVIRWFCKILGYDNQSFGYLTTSGSIANLMGLMCACHHVANISSQSSVLYTSEQAHFSVHKSAALIGIPASHINVIETHPDYTMNVDQLVNKIDEDRAGGLQPACVIATAGTTNTGAIDDLSTIAGICRERNIWLHVDASFGGFFRITARGRAALQGIEQADSIAVDAHKSLFLPHGSSALLIKDRTELLATFKAPVAAYLPGTPPDDDLIDFCNYGPELSREVRGLTAWLPIKMHGIVAFERCLDEKLDLIQYLDAQLREMHSIEVVTKSPIHLPVIAFKLRTRPGPSDAALNEKLCEVICSKGRVYVTTTRLPIEGTVIRVCILNHRTQKRNVDELLADIRSAVRAVLAELPASGFSSHGLTNSARQI